MTYATREAMVERFGDREVADLEHAGVSYQQVFKDTDGVINAYLSGSYNFPFRPCALLTGIACDIARYKIRCRMVSGAEAVSDDVRLRYKDALAMLKEAADGTLSLDEATKIGNTGTRIISRADERIFTKERGLKGWA